MKLKHNVSLLFILCLFFTGIYSCSDSKTLDEVLKDGVVKIEDVLLEQTINEGKTFNLTEKDGELVYVTQISIPARKIDWTGPILTQNFHVVEEILEDKITVTDAKGNKMESLEVKVDKNQVTISFLKASNTYDYMSGAKIYLNVVTKLKTAVTNEALEALKEKGFSSQSILMTDVLSAQQAKSNLVTVFPSIDAEQGFNAKGDPRNSEYKYQLNVVYFLPTDIHENPQFRERLSKIFFEHQLFVRKWMKHWGYEEKSYGLTLDEEGMVDIIVVKGKGAKADYPYDGSAPKMIQEVKDHFKANNIKFKSEHTLIMTAVNEDLANGVKVPDTPFYGYGKWCFALDYPGMSQEAMGQGTAASHVATVWIGGMLHELGHGLNKPHVGPTYSQKNDANFGISLMGAGNRTYGESPTFLHHASAAILSNCQVGSFVEKEFYGDVTASVKITDVDIQGNQCTVRGNYESSTNVTDVIVRFHNATENHNAAAGGYTSVAFVVKPKADKTFEAIIPIEELKVNTFNYKLGATILLENGTPRHTARDEVYYLEGNTLKSTYLNKSKWIATASHNMPKDAVDNNSPTNLIDNDASTLLALVKPGKSYGGVTVAAVEVVHATINMGEQVSFNTVSLSFNKSNTRDWLRATRVSFYGSNDGTQFELIKDNNVLDVTKSDVTVNLGKTVKWQYLKMTYDDWHKDGGTMQFGELGLQLNK